MSYQRDKTEAQLMLMDARSVATTAEQRAAAARVVRARLEGTEAEEVISALNLEGVAP